METKQSFSTSEVARFCHVTPDTIRKWAEAGRIGVFKTPGGHRRIRREDLVQFLNDNGIPLHADLSEESVRVLLVDDEKSIISMIRRFLERAKTSFEIQVATDGYDAGHLIGTFHPAVVFLDIRLPGLDGFEVCQRIKTAPETASTHIIAMTGYYKEEIAKRIIEMGAATCLKKPFTPDDLRRALALASIELE